MHDSDQVPPVPSDRNDVDARWRWMWRSAHLSMAPLGRTPAPYLIDRLIKDFDSRGWIAAHFAQLAATTRSRGADEVQSDGTLLWYVPLVDPLGVPRIVRMVVNPRTNQIFNAFPDRGRR